MKNYRVEYQSAESFDIAKTGQEVGNYGDYVVVKTLGQAKKHLKRFIKNERDKLSCALWTIDNHFTKDKL